MNVRCKMRVTSVATRSFAAPYDTSPVSPPTGEVELTAVSGEANKGWSKYTPSGSLKLQITNPEAFDQFKPGAYVYVDFSEAPATDEKSP